MQNKIKLFIYTIIGVGIPFLLRTNVATYPINNITSPYLTFYLNSLDLVLLFFWLSLFLKIKRIPFSGGKIVDKLWISLFLLIFMQVFFVEYAVISWVWGVRLFIGISTLWYSLRFKAFTQELQFLIKGMILGMVGQFIVASTQMVLQKNIGLPFVTESVISSDLAGVAKVNIFNNILVRAYGTFPHPNILGFVAILSLLILYGQKLSKKATITVFLVIVCSAGMIDHYILTSIQAYLVILMVFVYLVCGEFVTFAPRLRIFLVLIFHILVMLTFSKWAFIALVFMDMFYLTNSKRLSLFHVEQFQSIKVLVAKSTINAISLVGGILLLLLPYQQIVDTIVKRELYLQDAISMTQSHLWLGVGLGQYVANLSENREFWQYEPVHNVFLLILSEIGLLGILIVLMLLICLCYNHIYGHKK